MLSNAYRKALLTQVLNDYEARKRPDQKSAGPAPGAISRVINEVARNLAKELGKEAVNDAEFQAPENRQHIHDILTPIEQSETRIPSNRIAAVLKTVLK